MMKQLQSSRSGVYLRWHAKADEASESSKIDYFVPADPWILVSSIKDRQATQTIVDVDGACRAKGRPPVNKQVVLRDAEGEMEELRAVFDAAVSGDSGRR